MSQDWGRKEKLFSEHTAQFSNSRVGTKAFNGGVNQVLQATDFKHGVH